MLVVKEERLPARVHTHTPKSTASLWTIRNRYNHARIDLGRIDPFRGVVNAKTEGYLDEHNENNKIVGK